MKITDLEQQKKRLDRFNVFIDGNFAFGVSADLRFEKKLEVGQNLSEKQIAELINLDQAERLLAKSLRFLSFRPRSEREIRDHLLRKGKLKDIKGDDEKAQYERSVETVIKKLENLGQIDDYEFAKWWVDQRTRFRPRGYYVIRMELIAKGVSKEIVDELTTIKKEDQIRLALAAASKKMDSYKKLDSKNFKKKLGNYLLSRGFSWEVVKNIVDTLVDKR